MLQDISHDHYRIDLHKTAVIYGAPTTGKSTLAALIPGAMDTDDLIRVLCPEWFDKRLWNQDTIENMPIDDAFGKLCMYMTPLLIDQMNKGRLLFTNIWGSAMLNWIPETTPSYRVLNNGFSRRPEDWLVEWNKRQHDTDLDKLIFKWASDVIEHHACCMNTLCLLACDVYMSDVVLITDKWTENNISKSRDIPLSKLKFLVDAFQDKEVIKWRDILESHNLKPKTFADIISEMSHFSSTPIHITDLAVTISNPSEEVVSTSVDANISDDLVENDIDIITDNYPRTHLTFFRRINRLHKDELEVDFLIEEDLSVMFLFTDLTEPCTIDTINYQLIINPEPFPDGEEINNDAAINLFSGFPFASDNVTFYEIVTHLLSTNGKSISKFLLVNGIHSVSIDKNEEEL